MRENLRHPLCHPFAGWDVNRLVRAQAEAHGDRPFLIWEPFSGDTRIWTYAAFLDDVERVAAGLAARGVLSGDRVMVHLENCPETTITWYACARIGAVAVTTNARAAGPELGFFAEHAGAVACVTQPKFAERVAQHCPHLRWIAVTTHDTGEAPQPGQHPGDDAFETLLADPSGLPGLVPDPMREVGIQYTSGTTSRPKGVVWTHANALWGFRVNALHTGTTAADVHLAHMPLFHTNAQAYSLGAALYAGASCVVMPRFSASRFWSVALKHRCTFASMIVFSMRALRNLPVPERHHFRLWGASVSEPPTDALFNVRTMGWWGMTETMSHGIVGDWHHRNRPLSIGKPAPEYGIAVLDDDGQPARAGDVGHLRVKGMPGISLFKEYLHNPEATAEAYDDQGWFITGDRVILHDDGFIQFSDRDRDMLRVGGENVAASEIERAIMGVAGVEECAVVARRHPMLDEEPVAFVRLAGAQPANGESIEAAVISHCQGQLADFKVPRAVWVVSDFPRSTLEKIAKAELRRRVEEQGGTGP